MIPVDISFEVLLNLEPGSLRELLVTYCLNHDFMLREYGYCSIKLSKPKSLVNAMFVPGEEQVESLPLVT